MINNTVSTVTKKITLDEMIQGFPYWKDLIGYIRSEKDPLLRDTYLNIMEKTIDLYTESLKDLKTVNGAGDLYAKALNESYDKTEK